MTAADLVPISQSGSLVTTTTGELLAGTQPAILAPTGSLLGRISLGPGGPEPIDVGAGLVLESGTLIADVSTLRSVLGVGGAGSGSAAVAALPVVSSLAASDLIAVSQNGTNAAISLSNLLDGETIDEASPAGPASDTDSLWVGQGSSTMVRQTFGAVWAWAAAHMAGYKPPVLELSTNTTLDASVHNGRILVCSSPLTLSPAFATMGSGFACEVLNLSSGQVTFGTGFIVSSGQTALGPNQFASIRAVSYSQGNAVFAAVAGAAGSAGAGTSAPGSVGGLTVSAITASGATVSWTAPTTGGAAASYLVQYAAASGGASVSLSVPAGTTTSVLTSLAAGTSYTVTVAALNGAGASGPSSQTTFATAAATNPPGPPQNLAASGATASSVQLSWSPPTSGGAATSYTVQFSGSGSGGWSIFATGVTGTSITVTGLSPSTAYSFEVIATNAGGSSAPSTPASATTLAASGSVTSITWNVPPGTQYSVGNGAIGVNVHVAPSTAAVQFGLSTSSATAPSAWTAATHVNTDLWGAYVAVPTTAGTYYMWCEGTDGSMPTVYATPITVS
ncbi:MAG TPA: fibronectin type III domain-containing protein [Acetobacteraceae bacterium]|nr:fibronectin type III domain-containing protein [Acetobacteraceae bacterium]